MNDAYLQLLLKILKAIIENTDNPEAVYPLLLENSDKLDQTFILTLQEWATEQLQDADPDQSYKIASNLYLFDNIISGFPLGNRALNIEIAITCLKLALTVCTRESNAQNWALIQNSLGVNYRNRIQGETAQNIETAIACFTEALSVRTRKAFPQDWAMTQVNLGNAYGNRIQGEKAENLETAIACYTQALSVRTRKAFPQDWAMTQMNLGNAYSDRIQGEKAENIETAIACYTEALSVRTRKAFPQDWAMTQMNLGTAYGRRIQGEKAENIETAIACYTEALSVYTPKAFPEDWAITQMNLGTAYGRRIQGEKAENIETAITCYLDCLNTGRGLGNLGYDTQQWETAIHGYNLTIEAVEQLCELVSSPRRRQQVLVNALDVYEKMVQACLKAGREDLALTTIERSKSRSLVQMITDITLEPKTATDEQLQRFRGLRRQLLVLSQLWEGEIIDRSSGDDLTPQPPSLRGNGEQDDLTPQPPSLQGNGEQEVSGSDPLPSPRRRGAGGEVTEVSSENKTALGDLGSNLNTQRQNLQQQLNELLTEINEPEFLLTQKVQPITVAEIQTLLDQQTVILEWHIGTQEASGFQTFIISHNNLQVEEFTPTEWQTLDAWKEEYLQDYRQPSWTENLAGRLQKLGEILRLDDILDKIPPQCQTLILIPHRFLHLFPLHALEAKRNNDNSKQYLLDLFPQGVSYVPSCLLLRQLKQRQRPAASETSPWFGIQNPTQDLRYTQVEVEQIKQPFDPNTLILEGQQATKAKLFHPETLAKLAQSEYLHFSCHGSFNDKNPLYSALILAPEIAGETVLNPEINHKDRFVMLRDGRRFDTVTQGLTLGEIFAKLELPFCRLVGLSACETSLIDASQMLDEYIGLPMAFLYAGSLSVISSLWCVDDFATAFLMIRFYQNLPKENNSNVLALQAAQDWFRKVSRDDFLTWLRNDLKLDEDFVDNCEVRLLGGYPEHPFNQPLHWAPFAIIGL
ncbi:CHAT domain-containing protein [Planktothrix agardhii]|uniref:CHAT domain-containing protein n=1 Tax=Planktothrix agardhii TaxID=1160 RepID=UPI001F19CB4E|nr:CHAT domain-containing tetratricopeptide repeat protein [Planktothrix agardhii]MCF3644915.1 CHAT domain-containing protein [Planktothrix agardhii 1026]